MKEGREQGPHEIIYLVLPVYQHCPRPLVCAIRVICDSKAPQTKINSATPFRNIFSLKKERNAVNDTLEVSLASQLSAILVCPADLCVLKQGWQTFSVKGG